MVLKEGSAGLGAMTYLLNTVSLSRLFSGSEGGEVELTYPLEPCPKASVVKGKRQGLGQFLAVLKLWAVGLRMSPSAHDGCLLCGQRLLPIPQEICPPSPGNTSEFVYTSVPETLISYEICVFEINLKLFPLDSSRNGDLGV